MGCVLSNGSFKTPQVILMRSKAGESVVQPVGGLSDGGEGGGEETQLSFCGLSGYNV